MGSSTDDLPSKPRSVLPVVARLFAAKKEAAQEAEMAALSAQFESAMGA